MSEARDLFLHFYRPSTSIPSTSVPIESLEFKLETEKESAPLTPPSSPPSLNDANPSPEQLDVLAQRFADCIPAGSTSTSCLQGYFMRYKRDPKGAIENAKAWVDGGFKQELA